MSPSISETYGFYFSSGGRSRHYNRLVYSADLLDHFQNPRNAGEIEAPDRTARLENPVCGDILELTLRLDGDGNSDGSVDDNHASNAPKRISDIRFRAKGCVPVMACASALTELVKGQTLTAARQVSGEDVARKVGGLPQASTHASHLAVDALAQLLRDL